MILRMEIIAIRKLCPSDLQFFEAQAGHFRFYQNLTCSILSSALVAGEQNKNAYNSHRH